MAEWIGRTLSKVTIQKLIGRGGMAEVYLGLHTTLNRPVAVKILHGHLLEDDTSMSRFRSEAQAVANLRHSSIVQIFDFDVVEDRPYIVMELLEGPSLADHLNSLRQAGKVMPPEVTAKLSTTIASALDYAHARGIVHRDVKPSNVILRRESGKYDPNSPFTDDVQPVLTDFGVARLADTSIRTASGTIVGTPAYMSPEQVSGAPVDSRSDIYSFGIMVYQMLSGRLPFGSETDSVASTLVKHITESPAPLPEVTPQVQAAILRALAKDPKARHAKASEFIIELRTALGMPFTPGEMAAISTGSIFVSGPTIIGPKPPESSVWFRSPLTIAVAALLLVVIGAVIISLSRGTPEDNEATLVPTFGAEIVADEEFGLLNFMSSSAEADQITLTVTNVSPPAEGMQYEVWLLGGETRRSLGVIEVDAQGNGELTFTDDREQNLLAAFGRFEITQEPSPDTNPLPTNTVTYSGTVPAGVLKHTQHLLVSFGGAPDKIGLTIGIIRSAELMTIASQALSEAYQAEDLDEMKQQAEGLVNLIEGEGGSDYGDLDENGEVSNPGDPFGLLPGASSGGYIQSSIEHARYAAGSPDATPYVLEQVGYLEMAAQNLGGWAAQIRDEAIAIVQSKEISETEEHIEKIAELVDLFTHGNDVDQNGEISPTEGGTETVHYYALRMAGMSVLAGADRIPQPVPTNPAPNAVPETSSETTVDHEHGY